MNLSLNYQLICQISFLWLINFNGILGCISTRYMRKDGKIPSNSVEVPILSKTIDNIVINTPENESSIITAFQNYLAENYNWKISLFDLNILWTKLKEFSIKNGYTSRACTFRMPKKKFTKRKNSNMTILSIEDIRTYIRDEDSKIKISPVSGSDRNSHKANIEENVYFSKFEHDHAIRSANNFHDYGCQLRNETFCIRDFLKIQKDGIDDLFQSYPPALLLKRCPNKCSCLQPHEDCLPTFWENRTEYIYAMNDDTKKSTLPLVLVDHIGCKCRDRCLNKKCISHFEIVNHDRGSCECRCINEDEKVCEKILEGHRKFSTADYNCIVSGKCITPNCIAGKLSEEHLYLRHCPVRPYE